MIPPLNPVLSTWQKLPHRAKCKIQAEPWGKDERAPILGGMAGGRIVPFRCEECGGEFAATEGASAGRGEEMGFDPESYTGRPLGKVWA